MVAAAIRTIFAQPTGKLVQEQVEVVRMMLEPQLPAVATMLRDTKEENTAFAEFPEAHWRKIWSTNLLDAVWSRRQSGPRRRHRRQPPGPIVRSG